ncbi:hypothetical protein PIB30_062230 [Stylosanthes scabra]|uniref:FAE domain-containing protein n=1 Tax=Stylosanthes scabra TaxID=79078 RepID=A0ABU6SM39_9FABA|nr:hypothetical protein [Stylosanthes scabra]
MEPISKLSQSHASLLSKLLLTKLSNFMWSCTLFFVGSCQLFLILQNKEPRPSPVYLVDFSCYKPPDAYKMPFSLFIDKVSKCQLFDQESLTFMAKTLHASGLGEEDTYAPPLYHDITPRVGDQNDSFREVHMVFFPIIDDLLAKTNVSPTDIDILIVNCSRFCPSPSLSSIVINKYSMRSDIKSYNISGSGCSASALGIDTARRLLKVHENSNAIVLSTEILSTGFYTGKDKSKLILNCVFRMGSAAILLSNKKEAKKHAKYR